MIFRVIPFLCLIFEVIMNPEAMEKNWSRTWIETYRTTSLGTIYLDFFAQLCYVHQNVNRHSTIFLIIVMCFTINKPSLKL